MNDVYYAQNVVSIMRMYTYGKDFSRILLFFALYGIILLAMLRRAEAERSSA